MHLPPPGARGHDRGMIHPRQIGLAAGAGVEGVGGTGGCADSPASAALPGAVEGDE